MGSTETIAFLNCLQCLKFQKRSLAERCAHIVRTQDLIISVAQSRASGTPQARGVGGRLRTATRGQHLRRHAGMKRLSAVYDACGGQRLGGAVDGCVSAEAWCAVVCQMCWGGSCLEDLPPERIHCPAGGVRRASLLYGAVACVVCGLMISGGRSQHAVACTLEVRRHGRDMAATRKRHGSDTEVAGVRHDSEMRGMNAAWQQPGKEQASHSTSRPREVSKMAGHGRDGVWPATTQQASSGQVRHADKWSCCRCWADIPTLQDCTGAHNRRRERLVGDRHAGDGLRLACLALPAAEGIRQGSSAGLDHAVRPWFRPHAPKRRDT